MQDTNIPFVVKIGGSTLGSHDTTLEDLVSLYRKGLQPIVVHGGGKVISQWMERQGNLPRFVHGLRVTDPASLDIATAVLTGLVNKELVAALIRLEARAIGLSGVDGGMLQAEIQDPELGLVGRIVAVDPQPILQVLAGGYIPVIAPIGLHHMDGSPNAGCLLNINADTAAGEIAHALNVRKLIFLTDTEGVLDSSGRVISRITSSRGHSLLNSGIIKGGMLPKLEACLQIAKSGIQAHILDGRVPGALRAGLSGEALGTTIT